MKNIKGCFKKDCASNIKRIKYKNEDNFCPYCGNKLDYVCNGEKCYTMLPDDSEVYCIRCKAENEDKKNNSIKKATQIGSVGLGILGVVGALAVNLIKKGKGDK